VNAEDAGPVASKDWIPLVFGALALVTAALVEESRSVDTLQNDVFGLIGAAAFFGAAAYVVYTAVGHQRNSSWWTSALRSLAWAPIIMLLPVTAAFHVYGDSKVQFAVTCVVALAATFLVALARTHLVGSWMAMSIVVVAAMAALLLLPPSDPYHLLAREVLVLGFAYLAAWMIWRGSVGTTLLKKMTDAGRGRRILLHWCSVGAIVCAMGITAARFITVPEGLSGLLSVLALVSVLAVGEAIRHYLRLDYSRIGLGW
jgi:hypothetical protein